MNQSDIKKHYKNFGYLNLILSLLFVIVVRKIELIERIIGVIAINLGYHMGYLFFLNISEGSTLTNNNFNKIVGGIMQKFFSIFGILSSFIVFCFFTYNIIFLEEYYYIFILCIPLGIFIGSYSLWLDLKKEQ